MPNQKRIESIKQRLFWPRFQMSVILGLTAISAFAVSALLLAAGIDSMAVRYAAAVAAAYGVFLILLKLWLSVGDAWDMNIPDIDPRVSFHPGTAGGASSAGGGGDYAGAGAGGSWEGTSVPFVSSSADTAPSGGGVDVGLDLDEFALIVAAVVIAIGGVVAMFYVVYVAPGLLAEITLDALVAGGLYKAARRIEKRYWLRTAIRKTAVPAALCLILFAAAGYLIQAAVPEARTVGDLFRPSVSE